MSEFRKAIEKRFNQAQNTVCDVPTQRSGYFKATLTERGVVVSCLGKTYDSLEWKYFDAVENLLKEHKSAKRGDAMKGSLGDELLPRDSVEGCMAYCNNVVSGQKVFRRVSPVANLLVWAGVCKHGKGILSLL
jgi:hypothetical protein